MRLLAIAAVMAFPAIGLVAQGPSAGAVLDTSEFRYTRSIAPGPAALVVVPLDVAVLAHSRGPYGRFADVRIVDGENRQVPYLLEQAREPLELPVSFDRVEPTAEDRRSEVGQRSAYRIVLPYPRLPEAELVIETSLRTFRRDVQLSEEVSNDERGGRRTGLVTARLWQHADESATTPPLVLPARAREATDLLLTIDEGDNAPLPLTSVRLRLPAWRIRFYRPEGAPLRLLYGSGRAAAPEYDLALSRAKVMAESATEISVGAEQVKQERAAILSPRMFWGFLIAAVLVLVGLIARLATSRSSEDLPPPSGPRP